MGHDGLLNHIIHDDEGEAEELIEIPDDEFDEHRRDAKAPFPFESSCVDSPWLKNHEELGLPLVIIDSSLLIRWRNHAFRQFREREGLEYTGRPLPSLFSDFADVHEREALYMALANKDAGFGWQGRVHGRGPDNRNFIADLTIYPLDFDEADTPELYVCTIHDVTPHSRETIKLIFKSLLQASLVKDEDTGNHVERVNRYCRALAKTLQGNPRWPEVDKDYVEDIGFLAAFHDVGKIGTPDNILLKPGKLTDQEWSVMKEHPINGAIILDSHPNPMAKDIARSHHERWDGSGYPYGLAGEMIPLCARIVAIADVYDALRSKRSYKPSFSPEKTVDIMKKEAGTHFDAELISVFESIRGEFDEIFRQMAD